MKNKREKYLEDKITILLAVLTKLGYITHVHDHTCDNCGAADMVMVRDENHNAILRYCDCGQIQEFKKIKR